MAVVWGGIVVEPWAIGQTPEPAEAPPPIAAQPTVPAFPSFDTVEVHGVQSDPFGSTSGYTVTYGGRAQQADPAIVKAKQLEAKIQRQARELVAKYASTDDADARAEVKKGLNSLLKEQFELQKEVREVELSRLEEKVKKLRDLLDKRSAQKDEIVERRVEQLLLEADGLGWGESNDGAFTGTFWPAAEAGSPAMIAPAAPAPPPLPPTPAAAPSRAGSGVR